MVRLMKDSGIEWIGQIPEEWDRTELIHLLRNKITDGPHETPEYVEHGIPFISVDSLNTTKYVDLSNCKRFISEELYNEYCKKTIVEKGDILFTKAATIGKTAIAGEEKYMVWSPIAIIKPNTSIADNGYLYYILNCTELIQYVSFLGSMNTQINVGMRELEKAYIPFPPTNEQTRIAAYLDSECAKIDAVLEATRASIEEYKKLKQAVITQAVTKGVRGNRAMKDSGIEWIDEIPADWDVKPFKYILNERNEKNAPVQTEERLSLSIDLGVTLYAEKTTNLDRFKEDVTQYKLAHEGDLVLNSMNMIVGAIGVSPYFGCVSPAYYTFYDNEKNHITARYYDYFLRSKIMRRVLFSMGKGIYAIERGDDRVNTCRLKVSREDLRSMKLPLPSTEEQTEIVNYLDRKSDEIDVLIGKKEQFITELENYRKSLIYECVTGKREVFE